MWMDFGCETSFVPEMPETSQHFFYEVIRPGLADKRKRRKSFFEKVCWKPRITRIKRMNSEIERRTSGSDFFW
jgi:hypothetical protein